MPGGIQTEIGLPDFNFHDIRRSCVSSQYLTCPVWTALYVASYIRPVFHSFQGKQTGPPVTVTLYTIILTRRICSRRWPSTSEEAGYTHDVYRPQIESMPSTSRRYIYSFFLRSVRSLILSASNTCTTSRLEHCHKCAAYICPKSPSIVARTHNR